MVLRRDVEDVVRLDLVLVLVLVLLRPRLLQARCPRALLRGRLQVDPVPQASVAAARLGLISAFRLKPART